MLCDCCGKPIAKRGDLVVAGGFYGIFNATTMLLPSLVNILAQLADVFNCKKFHSACYAKGETRITMVPFKNSIVFDMAYGNIALLYALRTGAYVFFFAFAAATIAYLFLLGFLDLDFTKGSSYAIGGFVGIAAFILIFIGLKVLYPLFQYLRIRNGLPK